MRKVRGGRECSLFSLMVSWVYTYGKAYQTVHCKGDLFIACQLHFHNTVSFYGVIPVLFSLVKLICCKLEMYGTFTKCFEKPGEISLLLLGLLLC